VWKYKIGIIGGLGPFAHIEFERYLLKAIPEAKNDQDYPQWILSSIPETPDRTAAYSGKGASPVPSLIESVKRIEHVADFAVIVCNTAHIYYDHVQKAVSLPLLNMIQETLLKITQEVKKPAKIGLLGTTGTLSSNLYQKMAAKIAPELEIVTLLDLKDGTELQGELIMTHIFGTPSGENPAGCTQKSPSIKGGDAENPHIKNLFYQSFIKAADKLKTCGVVGIIPACTEISIIMGNTEASGIPLFDPVSIAAQASIDTASGKRPLP
jgi:aspartate racemase